MDIGWIAAAIVVVINIFGWGVTWGKLNGRIKNMETTMERHEKILWADGLADKISDLASRCSGLEGTLQTYIDLHKR